MKGGGGDNPDMNSPGWFQVGMLATSWAAAIIIRMIYNRIAFLVTYEAMVLMHVVSTFDWG